MKARQISAGFVLAVSFASLAAAQPRDTVRTTQPPTTQTPAGAPRAKGQSEAASAPAPGAAAKAADVPPLARVAATQAQAAKPPDAPAGRMVMLEVLVAETTAPVPQPSAAAILELEKAGKLAGQMRVRLAAVENQTARVQFGETVARATGRAIRPDGGFRGGGGFTSYSDVQVGTIVQATSRVEADGAIVAELKIDRSNLASAPRSAVPGEPNPDQPPQGVGQLSLQSTVRIKPSEAVIVGGRDAKSGDEASQTWVVLTAQVAGNNMPASPLGQLPIPAPSAVSELKVFTLKHASAPELAPVLSSVFAGQPVRFSVDPRTNSLLVIGPVSSLETARALVTRLDAQ